MVGYQKLDIKLFEKISKIIYDQVGIVLNEKKYSLVSARIAKRIRELKLSNFNDYYNFLIESDDELVELLNAISTNVTHFYRESHSFEVLANMLQKWESDGANKIRIWCAAASTGQEPYTLAITMKENLHNLQDAKLLATDINTRVLDFARRGIYTKNLIDKVPSNIRAKYFRKNKLNNYEISSEAKSIVKFGRINLVNFPYPLKGPLDAIFCRNVMIYFDNPTRTKVVN